MRAGAMVHARLKRPVDGADDPKAGAVHSVLEVLNHPQLNHQMEVQGGVLAGRCAELFGGRRSSGAVVSGFVLTSNWPLATDNSLPERVREWLKLSCLVGVRPSAREAGSPQAKS